MRDKVLPATEIPDSRMTEVVSSFAERELSPGLYIVATPIGNLEDITLRALRILQQADVIACEDTRQTQKLLNYFGIQKRTISYHEHNEIGRSQELLGQLPSGAKIALVSDAGMPGISDPGAVLIRQAVEQGIPVIPIPGASALISALVASGLPTETFRFFGFIPAKPGRRRTFLEELKTAPYPLVFYEAPHRVVQTLADILAVFGANRQIVIARELTKLHEEFLRGSVAQVLEQLRDKEIKGEITLLIAGYEEESA